MEETVALMWPKNRDFSIELKSKDVVISQHAGLEQCSDKSSSRDVGTKEGTLQVYLQTTPHMFELIKVDQGKVEKKSQKNKEEHVQKQWQKQQWAPLNGSSNAQQVGRVEDAK